MEMVSSSGSSSMSSSLSGWSAKISRASSRLTSRRTMAAPDLAISAMRASMAAKSSGETVTPSGSSMS